MKQIAGVAALIALVAANGCATPRTAAPAHPPMAVLDVAPQPPRAANPIVVYPPTHPTVASPDTAKARNTLTNSSGPLITQTPVAGKKAASAQAGPLPSADAAAGGAGTGARYTVRKGDTLFKIAQQRYGDGKQWQKIASANPGLTPQSLRAGQTLNMP